ncbi:MAG: metallophosphoesterase [Chloroflexota bacterium]
MRKGERRRRVVVGDVHGEFQGFTEILRHAGVIDGAGDWSGKDTVLIQTGDVIDRGPRSLECVALLRMLQRQARRTGGKVVRLCGNHELMLLQGDYRYVNFESPGKLKSELKREIAEDDVTASYSDGERMYTHAGLRSRVSAKLLEDIRNNGAPGRRGAIGFFALSDHINEVFKASVMKGDLHGHVIFDIDTKRGGSDEYGGIFRGDYTLLKASAEAWMIPQAFGHTPARGGRVRHSWNLKLINVDAGICKVYGGFRVYLEIDAEGRMREHGMNEGRWSSRILG